MNYDEILIFTWRCDVVWYIIILIIRAPFLLFGGFLDRFLLLGFDFVFGRKVYYFEKIFLCLSTVNTILEQGCICAFRAFVL